MWSHKVVMMDKKVSCWLHRKWKNRIQYEWLWNFERGRVNDYVMMPVVYEKFLCGNNWRDIHNGNSTPSSFQWNIFLKSFCDSWNHFCMAFDRLWNCKSLSFFCNKLVRALKIQEYMCLTNQVKQNKNEIHLYLKVLMHLKKSFLSKYVFEWLVKTR